MTHGSKEYKAWLSTLKVGSKVVLAGKDCPKEERGKVKTVETFSGNLTYVRCVSPYANNSRRARSLAFLEHGGFGFGMDYYLMPVPNELHKFEPKHHSIAAKKASEPKHPSQRMQVFKAIAQCRIKAGACNAYLKTKLGWESGQVSKRLSELARTDLIEQTNEIQCKHCKHSTGMTHYRITPEGKERL